MTLTLPSRYLVTCMTGLYLRKNFEFCSDNGIFKKITYMYGIVIRYIFTSLSVSDSSFKKKPEKLIARTYT